MSAAPLRRGAAAVRPGPRPAVAGTAAAGAAAPLHILIANVHFRPYSYGGATLVAEWMAEALARRGHRVSVFATRPGSRADACAVTRTTPFPGVDAYLVALPPGRAAALSEDNPAVAAALLPLAARLAPDVAHLHCLQDLGAGLLPGLRALGVPTLLSFHDYWWACARQFLVRADQRPCTLPAARAADCAACAGPGAPARLARLAAIARQADLRTAPGRTAADFCEASGCGPVAVWENGIPPPGPGFAAARAGRTGPPVFGYLGGPSTAKGWPVLRAAARRLGREGLVFHAVDGGVLAPWWRPGAFDGLPGDWRLLPRFDHAGTDAFYAGIDALVFPSRWRETFGLTVREALARGIRVIRTGPGGQAEHPAAPGLREFAYDLPEADAAEALARAIAATADEIAAGAPRTLPPVAVRTVAAQADALEAMLRRAMRKAHAGGAAGRARAAR